MDPLPKAICVQCLGKLEFVCDFQEECLRTQHELRNRYNLPPLTEFVSLFYFIYRSIALFHHNNASYNSTIISIVSCINFEQ